MRPCLFLLLILGGVWNLPMLLAQSPNPALASPDKTTNSGRVSPPMPPMPPKPTIVPIGQSPIATFRKLLAQAPAEREQSLAPKPESQRQRLLAKLQEYDALPVEEQELRLQVLELRWYLFPLMRAKGADRQELLTRVPAEYRTTLESRLEEWDRLSPDLQKEAMNSQMMQQHFARIEGRSPAEQDRLFQSLPAIERKQLEEQWHQWQTRTAEERQQMFARLNRLFDLSETEKQKTLRLVPEERRRQAEITLQSLEHLPVQERQRALEIISKLSYMAPAQRQRFITNAARWKAMTQEERTNWVKFVTQLPHQPRIMQKPPLPPEMAPRPAGPLRVEGTTNADRGTN